MDGEPIRAGDVFIHTSGVMFVIARSRGTGGGGYFIPRISEEQAQMLHMSPQAAAEYTSGQENLLGRFGHTGERRSDFNPCLGIVFQSRDIAYLGHRDHIEALQ